MPCMRSTLLVVISISYPHLNVPITCTQISQNSIKMNFKTKNSKTLFLLSLLTILFISTSLISARPESFGSSSSFNEQLNKNPKKASDNGPGGFFGPGSGFGNIPGFGNGWGNGIGGGYGGGFGGPSGGYSKGGIIRSSAVCKEKGPCYMKKLTCPAKCFSSFSRSGKGYGGGGGGGGCTIDCKKKCVAYC